MVTEAMAMEAEEEMGVELAAQVEEAQLALCLRSFPR